ncbi:hypothetical protein HWQ46_01230 [Shewanella sp. D64]|uniref:hypothetical protein n=1 Tax=unclassified Shewanella TaxID=196818 RepID=UPI0022BA12EE|nr:MULTISPECIES: hypothetical protein [unclassified Shewanella]MEC4724172.1 hypothetical protein [Shewanella sp. D64]MEC4736192.1 hypothetical protein [Shewanella sp. E94]WBJ97873.1 hypothetical protein HWQ47_12625 [Shewanella sp. MTB7]
MNVIGINGYNPASSGDFSRLEVKTTKSHTPEADTSLAPKTGSTDDGIKVSISKEGKDALASNSGSALHAQSFQIKAQAEATEESDAPKKKIDELIKALKERVEELKVQLKLLENDKTEAGEKKRKDLGAQIAVLSAQITDLINQKIEQEIKEKLKNS